MECVEPARHRHALLEGLAGLRRLERDQRERERLQQRQQREERDRRRRERPEKPNERQFFADASKREGGARPGKDIGPRSEGKPRHDGPPRDNRGPRPPRRDSGGPALRLYATTEKKGDAVADSPFAKLLELKLGGKK